MSMTPNGDAPAECMPTSHGPRDRRSSESSTHAASRPILGVLALVFAPFLSRGGLTHGKRRPSGPRAAYSHSSSVGRRFPAHAQYVFACSQSTQLTGFSSPPDFAEALQVQRAGPPAEV